MDCFLPFFVTLFAGLRESELFSPRTVYGGDVQDGGRRRSPGATAPAKRVAKNDLSLLTLDNVVLLPRVGSGTHEIRAAMADTGTLVTRVCAELGRQPQCVQSGYRRVASANDDSGAALPSFSALSNAETGVHHCSPRRSGLG